MYTCMFGGRWLIFYEVPFPAAFSCCVPSHGPLVRVCHHHPHAEPQITSQQNYAINRGTDKTKKKKTILLHYSFRSEEEWKWFVLLTHFHDLEPMWSIDMSKWLWMLCSNCELRQPEICQPDWRGLDFVTGFHANGPIGPYCVRPSPA